MKNEFATYEQSLILKELGFDEDCFAFYERNKELVIQTCEVADFHINSLQCLAPLKQQVFRWFENKHSLYIQRNVLSNVNEILDVEYFITSWRIPPVMVVFNHDSFDKDKDESACIDKLIEIVKSK